MPSYLLVVFITPSPCLPRHIPESRPPLPCPLIAVFLVISGSPSQDVRYLCSGSAGAILEWGGRSGLVGGFCRVE